MDTLYVIGAIFIFLLVAYHFLDVTVALGIIAFSTLFVSFCVSTLYFFLASDVMFMPLVEKLDDVSDLMAGFAFTGLIAPALLSGLFFSLTTAKFFRDSNDNLKIASRAFVLCFLTTVTLEALNLPVLLLPKYNFAGSLLSSSFLVKGNYSEEVRKLNERFQERQFEHLKNAERVFTTESFSRRKLRLIPGKPDYYVVDEDRDEFGVHFSGYGLVKLHKTYPMVRVVKKVYLPDSLEQRNLIEVREFRKWLDFIFFPKTGEGEFFSEEVLTLKGEVMQLGRKLVKYVDTPSECNFLCVIPAFKSVMKMRKIILLRERSPKEFEKVIDRFVDNELTSVFPAVCRDEGCTRAELFGAYREYKVSSNP